MDSHSLAQPEQMVRCAGGMSMEAMNRVHGKVYRRKGWMGLDSNYIKELFALQDRTNQYSCLDSISRLRNPYIIPKR
jgi:hypothetical protein